MKVDSAVKNGSIALTAVGCTIDGRHMYRYIQETQYLSLGFWN